MAVNQNRRPSTGIPQGSVAGPGTFPLYTQPLAMMVQEHSISVHLYADDTQLYVGCDVSDCRTSKEDLENCVDNVRSWMASNMLKLNENKTEYMVLGSRHTLKQVPSEACSLTIGDVTVTSSKSARNIGVIMDSTLSMESQVTSICRSCYSS